MDYSGHCGEVVETTVKKVRRYLNMVVDEVRWSNRLTLLMDEKIFHRLAKFMYSRTYNPFKLAEHYATVPMLYGCWHPYKYVCTMMHRKLFPILGCLGRQSPIVEDEIMCHPKLLHIEKQFCALMLATPTVSECIAHKGA